MAAWPNPGQAPGRAPRGLERLCAACMRAEAEDSRLGDLSEQYVRTHARALAYLGDAPLTSTLSRLVADLRYLFAAANVVLFARVVDPGLRLAAPGAMEAIVLELTETIMTSLHAAARTLLVPALLLVGTAFLINGVVNVWTTWRETEALIIDLQREKAEAAAAQIDQYVAALAGQIAWAAERRGAVTPEHRREDYLRLLRQTPAITEIAHVNEDGRESLRVSRLARDTLDSGVDFSRDVRFTETLKHGRHVGPVYFNQRSEPRVSLAVAHAKPNPGVTVAEVDIKRLWDIVDAIKAGETGYAYVVDGNGRLIASRDRASVLRGTDLSDLPQVAVLPPAARTGAPDARTTFDTSLSGAAVLSVHAPISTAAWRVYVELPIAEAQAPLRNALVRAAFLLGLGLLAMILASFVAARRVARAAPAGI